MLLILIMTLSLAHQPSSRWDWGHPADDYHTDPPMPCTTAWLLPSRERSSMLESKVSGSDYACFWLLTSTWWSASSLTSALSRRRVYCSTLNGRLSAPHLG